MAAAVNTLLPRNSNILKMTQEFVRFERCVLTKKKKSPWVIHHLCPGPLEQDYQPAKYGL